MFCSSVRRSATLYGSRQQLVMGTGRAATLGRNSRTRPPPRTQYSSATLGRAGAGGRSRPVMPTLSETDLYYGHSRQGRKLKRTESFV